MEAILVYRGRPITREDIEFIRGLIDSNPDEHRTALSRKICRVWKWTQPNGHLVMDRNQAHPHFALTCSFASVNNRNPKPYPPVVSVL